jgi:hypothetical protein
MLLFSRTHSGRIYVVEIDATLESIFRAVNGTRTVDQIAARASTNLQAAQQALEALAKIDAVRVR